MGFVKYLDLKRINEPYEHAADEVLQSGWYLRGEATRRFEEHYAAYIGTKHCVACANGLDALTLILRAYKELGRLCDGDEVIVPANTYIASILAVTENRLTPVLVEPDITTLQIDDRLIEQAITHRTRAIMIVHLYGRCAYTDTIGELCTKHGLLLIEDNAQAHGCRATAATTIPIASAAGRRTGALGHAAAHSFYPTKNLGAFGDAGAVTTDDDTLADLIRALGNYGSARHYVFDHLGRNSRIDELQAAILDAKLRDLDAANQRRKEIAAIYINKVNNPTVTIPVASDHADARLQRDSVWHIFPILCACRDELRQYLLDNGIETEIHYPIPPHKQRCYPEWHHLSFPITERIHAQELSIPCNPAVTDEEACHIADLLNSFKLSHS